MLKSTNSQVQGRKGSFYCFFLSKMGVLSEQHQSCSMTQTHDESDEEIGGMVRYAGQRTRGSTSLALSHASVWRRGCLCRKKGCTRRPGMPELMSHCARWRAMDGTPAVVPKLEREHQISKM